LKKEVWLFVLCNVPIENRPFLPYAILSYPNKSGHVHPYIRQSIYPIKSVADELSMMAQVLELSPGIFHSGSCIQVVGGTSSGKSTVTQGILQYCQELFDKPVKGIFYAHDSPQPLHREI
jgi:hypothetical protein